MADAACPPPADRVCACRQCREQLSADLQRELSGALERALARFSSLVTPPEYLPAAFRRERDADHFGRCLAADTCTMDPDCQLHGGCVTVEAS